MEIQGYFKEIINNIEQKLKETPELPNSRKLFTLHISRLAERLYDESTKKVWCGVAAPFDLLNTYGFTSCFIEFVGAFLSGMGVARDFMNEAEELGYPSDSCGYHRAVFGASKLGVVPKPEFILATTAPCSGGLALMENLAKNLEKPLYILHIPLEMNRTTISYLRDEFYDLVDLIKVHTGNALDLDMLSETVKKTNKASALIRDIYNLSAKIPSPVSNKDLKNLGILLWPLLGTDNAIEIAEAFKKELTLRLTTNPPLLKREKYRLLWIQNRIQFKNKLFDELLEKEYHAKIVIDELNAITWEPIDPSDPMTGIAERILSIPLNGAIKRRIEHLKQVSENYRIDGVINPCHFGCRQGTGARGLIEAGLKEIGIPVLNLEVDCIDSTNFAEGQLKTRLEAFFEMVDTNRKNWS